MHLALVAHGDPLDGKTWSGTPKAIAAAMGNLDVVVSATDCSKIPRLQKLAILCVNLIFTGNAFFRDSLYYKRACSKTVIEFDKTHEVDAFLHMGTRSIISLPIELARRSVVYLDFPFCSQIRYRGARVNDNLIADNEGKALRNLLHIFVTSTFAKRDLIDNYGLEDSVISVVGTGYNEFLSQAIKTTTKKYDNKNILFSSKVDSGWSYKGGEILAQALYRLRERDPDITLTSVGSEYIAKKLKSVPGATGYGYVSAAELATLYSNASIFCMPAPAEPWGLVYLEALSTATPILGSGHLGAKDIVEATGGGWLVNPNDLDDLSNTLYHALQNPDELRRRGEAGRRQVSAMYSWDKIAQLMLNTVSSFK